MGRNSTKPGRTGKSGDLPVRGDIARRQAVMSLRRPIIVLLIKTVNIILGNTATFHSAESYGLSRKRTMTLNGKRVAWEARYFPTQYSFVLVLMKRLPRATAIVDRISCSSSAMGFVDNSFPLKASITNTSP